MAVNTPTVVITGASNGGIGAQVALCLAAAHPAEILLLGRSEDKTSSTMKQIRQISASTKARFIKVDLASCTSVRSAASEVASTVARIDVLINNAGIMGSKFSLTPENVESQFGTNHVGHFLLTNLLIPKLEAAGRGSRVVNVSSHMYQFSPVRFDDYNFSNGKTFNTWEAYGQSKTANILFSVALARRLAGKGVKSYSLHPGNIQATNLASNIDPAEFPVVGAMFAEKKIDMPPEKTLEEGSSTTLVAALDPELDSEFSSPITGPSMRGAHYSCTGVSGAYLADCNPTKALDYACSQSNADELWALSEKIVGQEFSY